MIVSITYVSVTGLNIHQMKRYRVKQRYRADFSDFFWRDNVSPGVLDMFLGKLLVKYIFHL